MTLYFKDRQRFDQIVKNISDDWYDKLHVLSDFDRTLTKHFVDGQKRPSIVSVLRSEGYLWEEYSKKAFELYTSEGKKVKYSKMLKKLQEQDLVFFGEYHQKNHHQ